MKDRLDKLTFSRTYLKRKENVFKKIISIHINEIEVSVSSFKISVFSSAYSYLHDTKTLTF